MPNETHYGPAIQHLRESAGLSQAQLAKQLPFTASRISRIETGELGLSNDEAQQLALAIGTEPAKAFAEYLGWQWKILEAPGFEHISRDVLWKAEQAMQRLTELTDDPDLKNAFLKQIDSCRQALERAANFLLSTELSVVFVVSPGVGKSTVVCALSEGLRDTGAASLKEQMNLPTGAGRTTICEVQVRRGGEYGIVVEPCSEDELRYHVADFCEHPAGSEQRPAVLLRKRHATRMSFVGGISEAEQKKRVGKHGLHRRGVPWR